MQITNDYKLTVNESSPSEISPDIFPLQRTMIKSRR